MSWALHAHMALCYLIECCRFDQDFLQEHMLRPNDNLLDWIINQSGGVSIVDHMLLNRITLKYGLHLLVSMSLDTR